MRVRALVVDDSPIVQKAHKIFLEQAGCEVDVADSAETALALQPNQYQIIFLDLNLPGMSGMELANEIRRREIDNKVIPIIVVSATLNASVRNNNDFSANINEFISKPLCAKQIGEILQRWVK